MTNPYTLVEIEWKDAVSFDAWHTKEHFPTPATVFTVGYLVKDDPDYVVLSMSFGCSGKDEEFGPTFTIPRGMIQHVRRLGTKEDE